MAVLIKNMEMPDCCGYCPQFIKLVSFNFFDNSCLCRFGGTPPEPWPMRYEKRAEDCPLIPVPPHGRLIEETKVLDIVSTWCPDDDWSVGKVGDPREMLDEIEALPTIIPAEEGE